MSLFWSLLAIFAGIVGLMELLSGKDASTTILIAMSCLLLGRK